MEVFFILLDPTIILLICAVVALIVICLEDIIKECLFYRCQQGTNNTLHTRQRNRFDFAPGGSAGISTLRKGLEPSVLKSIPVVVFISKNFKDGLACAICLSDISEGEKARILPKCNHGFHVLCIDMWFHSHSTCPLCRNPISSQSSSSSHESTIGNVDRVPGEESSPNLPTNVLFYGNDTRVSTLGPPPEGNQFPNTQPPSLSSSASAGSSLLSSSSLVNNRQDEMLVIDIPREISEEEESILPLSTRVRSLIRLSEQG